MQAEILFYFILFTKRQNVKTISAPSYCLKFLGLKKYSSCDNIPLTLAKWAYVAHLIYSPVQCANTVQEKICTESFRYRTGYPYSGTRPVQASSYFPFRYRTDGFQTVRRPGI